MNGTYLDVGGPQVLEFFLPELHEAYGGSTPFDAYRNRIVWRLRHPWARRSLRVLVLRDERGNHLSHLHLQAIPALHFDREVWLGRIDLLLTPEKMRRQGHATALMRLTLDLLARERVEGAFLYDGIEGGLFEALGFRAISVPEIEAPIASLPDKMVEGIRIRALGSHDWPSISAIHRNAGSGLPLWFLRDRDRWEFLIAQWSGSGGRHPLVGFVAEGDPGIDGYLLGLVDREDFRLLEFGMAHPGHELLSSLLARARVEGERHGCARLTCPQPPEDLAAASVDSVVDVTSAASHRLLVASLNPMLDLEAVVSRTGGYWEFERI